ncbi:hypothetical protein IAT38_002502 [Cryptococcus sp. DSM 104549]
MDTTSQTQSDLPEMSPDSTAPCRPTKKRSQGASGPPYVPGARVGFSDLPTELVERVVYWISAGYQSLYPLLLTCKQTLYPAGDRFYACTWLTEPASDSNGPFRGEHGERVGAGLIRLFEGVGNGAEATVAAPFGRDLKLRFLSRITCLCINVHSSAGEEYDDQDWVADQINFTIDLLYRLRDAHIEPFPQIRRVDMFIGPHDLDFGFPFDIRGPVADFILALAAICRPEFFLSLHEGDEVPLVCLGTANQLSGSYVIMKCGGVDIDFPEVRAALSKHLVDLLGDKDGDGVSAVAGGSSDAASEASATLWELDNCVWVVDSHRGHRGVLPNHVELSKRQVLKKLPGWAGRIAFELDEAKEMVKPGEWVDLLPRKVKYTEREGP